MDTDKGGEKGESSRFNRQDARTYEECVSMFPVSPAHTRTPTHPVLVGTTPALNLEGYTLSFVACLFSSGHKDGFLLTPSNWRCWVENCAPSKLGPSQPPPTLRVVWGLWWVFSFLWRSQHSTALVQNTGPLGHSWPARPTQGLGSSRAANYKQMLLLGPAQRPPGSWHW